jgi:hypothetical protein
VLAAFAGTSYRARLGGTTSGDGSGTALDTSVP